MPNKPPEELFEGIAGTSGRTPGITPEGYLGGTLGGVSGETPGYTKKFLQVIPVGTVGGIPE